MNPALRHQLIQIDRALLALLDERVRLLDEDEAAGASAAARSPALEDLLRRHDGPLAAEGVREVFAAIERACERSRGEERGP